MARPSTTTVLAPQGLVASADHLASSAGLGLLQAGGTAVDAAIAANAVLAVVAPHLCGMGGDLFALVHEGDGPPAVVAAVGRAGSGADPASLAADGLDRVPLRGDLRAVTVPGCVDGWCALHERFGRRPLAEVLAPAVGYATDGFPASPLLAVTAPMVADVAGVDEWARGPVATGQRLRRPRTAEALRAVARAGRDGFYRGPFGDGLLALGAGLYEPADLATPLADWVEPVGRRVWGHDVWTAPPPSQGYLVLLAALAASALDLPDPRDPAWPHLLAEIARRAGADRPALLHEGAEADALLAPERVAAVLAGLDPDRRSDGVTLPIADGDTTVVTVVDRDRQGVTLIQSNAADFGAHLVEPATGTFLHDRGVGFATDPTHPAAFGPRRRPPHTLSPTLVTRPDGRLRAVLATMGGDTQPQIVLQVLARLLGAGQDAGRAIGGPRVVLDHPGGTGFDLWDDPDQLAVEDHAPAAWVEGLTARGHRVAVRSGMGAGFGHAQLIEVTADGLAGAADPRALVGAAVGH